MQIDGSAAERVADGILPPAPKVREHRAVDGRTLRVLLLEDDDVDAKIIGLQAAAIGGVLVTRAASADEARRHLEEDEFDLCILDFWLGCETVLRFLCEVGTLGPGLPAIVLTSLSTPDIQAVCRHAGAAAFLGKEALSPASLQAAIEAALETRRAAPDEGERPLAHLLGMLVDALDRAGRDPSDPTFRPIAAGPLDGLLGLTETVRFGLFEQALAAQRLACPAECSSGAGELVRCALAAVAIARDMFDARGQTVTVTYPGLESERVCASAAAFFLIFELVIRASDEAVVGTAIALDLRTEGQRLLITLHITIAIDAGAGVNPTAPLLSQTLREAGGSFAHRPDGRGGLYLEVSLATLPGLAGSWLH